MSLKKKIATSLATVALASALIGGATFAVFSDDASNANNTFATGTLDLVAGDLAITSLTDIANMQPGDVITGSFTVSNSGSVELQYDLDANKSGNLFDPLYSTTPATVEFTNERGTLAPGASATVDVTIELPLAAGNEYQGVDGSLNFDAYAEQTAHNAISSTLELND